MELQRVVRRAGVVPENLQVGILVGWTFRIPSEPAPQCPDITRRKCLRTEGPLQRYVPLIHARKRIAGEGRDGRRGKVDAHSTARWSGGQRGYGLSNHHPGYRWLLKAAVFKARLPQVIKPPSPGAQHSDSV